MSEINILEGYHSGLGSYCMPKEKRWKRKMEPFIGSSMPPRWNYTIYLNFQEIRSTEIMARSSRHEKITWVIWCQPILFLISVPCPIGSVVLKWQSTGFCFCFFSPFLSKKPIFFAHWNTFPFIPFYGMKYCLILKIIIKPIKMLKFLQPKWNLKRLCPMA